MKLNGDLESIKIDLAEADFPIYQGSDSNCRWTIIGTTIHKLDFYKFSQLPIEFLIPKRRQGEFLFEILPKLEKI